MAHDKEELIKAPPTAFRRRDAIAKAQYVVPVFAVLGVVGFGLGEWLVQQDVRYSPGPLANVHSQWNNQCAACHETLQPLASQNWAATISSNTHVADAKCQTCHAGPKHHVNEKPGETAGCTACHHEHLGVPGKLLAVGDAHCTKCHRDIASHVKEPGKYQKNVTGFASDHPEFALIEKKTKDPGTVKFNHFRHMSGNLGKLKQLPPEYRKQYAQSPDQSLDADIVLDCRSCHQTEARDLNAPKNSNGLPANAVAPDRGAGATMAPIVYEQHCQACHPLTVDPKIPPIRHRLQPKEIVESLRGRFANLAFNQLVKPDAAAPKPVLPGKAAEKVDADAKKVTETALFAAVDQRQKSAETILLGPSTCQKCHDVDPKKGADQTIEPANIPAVWFKQARFDHTAHRAVSCRECHPQAYASKESSDVMLPGKATCVNCHAPASGVGAHARGGARFDCIACHTYHHGDFPLHGRGSRARQPAGETRTIEEFLQGK